MAVRCKAFSSGTAVFISEISKMQIPCGLGLHFTHGYILRVSVCVSPTVAPETWQRVVEAGLTCLGAAFDPGLTLLSKEGTCLLSLSFCEAFKYT